MSGRGKGKRLMGELELAILKTFKGVYVTDYPGKGISLSNSVPHIWEGENPVNPPPGGGQLKQINRRLKK